METVAVVARAGKNMAAGCQNSGEVLAREGISDPLWFEVPKSRKAPGAPVWPWRAARGDVHLGR